MSVFALLGGEEGIRALVDRFYDEMERPGAERIRAMHPESLDESRRKLWMFLVGRFGGPPLYEQERGHPRLRMRHFPFAIGSDEADEWMACMEVALDAHVPDERLRGELWAFFRMVADQMKNR